MSSQSEKRRARCSLEFRGRSCRIVYSWKGARVRCRTPFGPEDVEKVTDLVELMARLLALGVDPRRTLSEMPVAFSPPCIADEEALSVDASLKCDAALPSEPSSIEPRVATVGPSVRMYYERWVQRMVTPHVRRAQQRDYRRHIENYVLPYLGELPLDAVTSAILCELRVRLLTKGGQGETPLKKRYVKNILGASLRAMITAAVEEGVISKSPFDSSRWRRWPDGLGSADTAEADPFMPEERDRIFTWFDERTYGVHGRRTRHLPFLGWIAIQFLTGMTPSEASGLQWQDVVLERDFVLVRRSYHLGRYAATKNKKRTRSVELDPFVTAILREMRPASAADTDPVFPSTNGRPLEPKSFSHWYRCLDALRIRRRGVYCMKDTFVSIALMTPGINVQWVERQTGVALETLKTHYAKWYPRVGQSELEKIREFEKNPAVTPALTPENAPREDHTDEKPARSQ